MKYDQLESRVQQKYAAVAGVDSKGIDPGTWAMIIDVIMKVLAGCAAKKATPADVVRNARRPVFARLMVRRQMRESDLDRADARAVVETIASLGADATEAEVAAVMNLELPVTGPPS